jgi:hypothetical protein
LKGPGYLRGVLESMWFRKLYLFSELLGFKARPLSSPFFFEGTDREKQTLIIVSAR